MSDVTEVVAGVGGRRENRTEPAAQFERPGIGWFVVLDGGLLKLGLLSFNRPFYEKVRGIVPLPEQDRLRLLFGGAVLLHIGEAVAARRMARRRGVPSGRWVRQTLLVGFPSLLRLRAIEPVGSPIAPG